MNVSESVKPTSVRWWILGLLWLVTTLTFIDRFNMSVAAKFIQKEYSLSDVQIGSLFSAFVLGYALLQAPGGWLGDRFGPRRMLTLAILWWSLFTALTAVAPEWWLARWMGVGGSLWLTRFLVGTGEGPALPNANKLLGAWMAIHERARGSSVFLVAVGTGGTFTPPLIAWMTTHWGWRTAFFVCGLLGIVVAAMWHGLSADSAEQHKRVNAAELRLIQKGRDPTVSAGRFPWGRVFGAPSIPALLLANFMLGYVQYIFYSWFFLYLVNVRHLSIMTGSYWSTAPFLAILIGSPLGGAFSDLLIRRTGLRWSRVAPVLAAACASCVLIFIGSRLENPYMAIIALALAAGCNGIIGVLSWTVPNDMSHRHAGSLAGVLNTTTSLGGAVSPTLTPILAAQFGWVAALDFAAAMMLCVAMLWLLVRADTRID